ncbi:hypothetical protein B3ORF19 [Pseudomonas phage B3]|uniref:Uncharacterized protein n=1 Tax=Pseudomonas phage B3 TaxID=151599 RepID=Q5ZQZ7_9CAUD|nr:hypothetical protein B3ORF19 [Pseudomonas phage B3]AAQ13937.1 hypothetical protein B3ORF19 [Pseudomonas phage B3]
MNGWDTHRQNSRRSLEPLNGPRLVGSKDERLLMRSRLLRGPTKA